MAGKVSDWRKDTFLVDFMGIDSDSISQDSGGFDDDDDVLCSLTDSAVDDESLVSYMLGKKETSPKKTGTRSQSREAAFPSSRVQQHMQPHIPARSSTQAGSHMQQEQDDVVLIDETVSDDDFTERALIEPPVAQDQLPVIVVTKSPAKSRGNSNSKGAVASRQRRLRTKHYVSSLEETNKSLSEENKQLKMEGHEKSEKIQNLEKQLKILKDTLANKSALSTFFNQILTTDGINVHTYSGAPIVETGENSQKGDCSSVSCQKRKHPDQILDETNSVVGTAGKWPCSAKVSSSPKEGPGKGQKRRRQLRDLVQNGGVDNIPSEHPISLSPKQHAIPGARTLEKASTNKTSGAVRKDCVDSETVCINCNGSVGHNSSVNGNGSVDGTDCTGDGAEPQGGICLHVLGDSVSIQLCANCNTNAAKSNNIQFSQVSLNS